MKESSTPTSGVTPSDNPYITPYEASRIALVHIKTLARWGDAGKIRMIRTLGGHRRYHRDDITPQYPQTEWSTL